ncbi:MAG TPA: hemerythrin domain-containing protein [Dehalococcoidia bacterium]|nr:hemerythrin domain-containing protein [Dehalococcoidia bacterium]
MPDANTMLRKDHRRVKELFRRFENTEDKREQKAIADQAIFELDIHSRLEEEIYYPAVRKMSGDVDEIMNEAEEEHHVVDVLMQELLKMEPSDPMFAAKFTVMSENVEHHIDEEESEMLPKAAELGMSKMEDLGARMERRKQELMRGTPKSGRRTNGARSSGGGSRRTASGKSRSK